MAVLGDFMVKMERKDRYVDIKVTDADIGRRLSHFDLNVSALYEIFVSKNCIIESDICNYCHMYPPYDGKIRFVILYTSADESGSMTGQREVFEISIKELRAMLDGKPIKKLFNKYTGAGYTQAKIVLDESAHRIIHKYAGNKITRHAMRKAFGKNFKYGRDETVFLYADFGEFGFSTKGLRGGLIAHTKTTRGRDRKQHPETYFGIHT